ncbi:elongation factor P hydroxylase [Halobacteriovorax sp.]|uniref:elongation factor P hydroxylase n=1 Tax=Halobacteriovorax sp. TaxID=2020862 RepID=UPI00356628B1
MKHQIKDLQAIFHNTFGEEYNISLEYGADEPFYYAAKKAAEKNILYCREDFYASALHEIAHWSLAGAERRKLDDYGFWYSPDGRDLEKQLEFERVEVKPQAIEKAFSEACSYPFKASVDNLSLENYDPSSFINNINKQFSIYQQTKFPLRAQRFINALEQFYS